MRYLSVCSGIEAATTAWHSLGWTPVAFSEVDPFPCAVLQHHYPDVPNWGDMTKFKEWPDATVDLLVGGTPCQSFSVAGLRKGLDDPRGNLMLTFLAIAAKYRPKWVVWENVPGVLSSTGGRDFAALLRGLAECGYGWSYRVLDAQYCRVDTHPFAVPQRRRRVFVVGHLGDWQRAAAVLLELESLRGDPAPRREAGKDATVCPTLRAGGNSTGGHRSPGTDVDTCDSLIPQPHASISPAIKARDSKGVSSDGDGDGAILVPMVAHSLRADGFDASEDGTGRGTDKTARVASYTDVRSNPKPGDPCHPLAAGAHAPAIAFHPTQDPISSTDTMHALGTGSRQGCATAAVAFTASEQANSYAWERDIYPTLNAQPPNDSSNIQMGIRQGMQVRRLTPRECERLQGFPDDYTLIQYRGKPAADGPRYKALGNSMAVNVMRWIGQRIQMVEDIK